MRINPRRMRLKHRRGMREIRQFNTRKVLPPRRNIDRVVIYHRDDETQQNIIYLASYAGAESAEVGRYRIQLTHIQYQ